MIHLTRINRSPLVLNSDLIEYIEKTPDTVVSLTNGLKLLVRESPDEIVAKVIEFRQCILGGVREIGAVGAVIFPVPAPTKSQIRELRRFNHEDKE